MEDLTQRLINALRKAVTNARNADDACEAAYLADALDAEGAPIMVPASATLNVDATPGVIVSAAPIDMVPDATGRFVVPEPPPVDNGHVAPGAAPFPHLPPAGDVAEPFPHPDVKG